MGKILKSYEFKQFGSRQKHPWDEWLDGRIHQLDEADFGQVSLVTMIALARRQGRKRGYEVLASVNNEERLIVLQAYEPDDGMTLQERKEKYAEAEKAKEAARKAKAATNREQETETEEEDQEQEVQQQEMQQQEPIRKGKKGRQTA